MFEVRWHGRGGQGAVTAARLLAEAAVTKGHYAQAFPEFGPERRGAPVQAFTRIGSSRIRTYYGISNPDAVVVLDATLSDNVDITNGLVLFGILLINTQLSPVEIQRKYRLKNVRIGAVDGNGISLDCLRVAIPNTAMIGALVKMIGILDLEDILSYFKEAYATKFTTEVLDGNLQAITRAYEEVKIE